MAIRIISGVLGAALLLGLLMLPQPIPPILIILAGVFAAYEFIVLTRAKWGFVVGGLLLSGALLSCPWMLMMSGNLILLALQLVFAMYLIGSVRRDRHASLDSAAFIGLPLLIAWPFQHIAVFAGLGSFYLFPGVVLLTVLALAWAADTGAFACGKLFGRHKLIPRVSPGKTWEGYIGGCFAVFAVVIALNLLSPVCEFWVPTIMVSAGSAPLWVIAVYSLVLGFALGTVALIGDLTFSAIKRMRGVKESGTFLPGHGGILDRIDGLLFVACWVFPLSLLIELPAVIYALHLR